jgi:hypothetical protein
MYIVKNGKIIFLPDDCNQKQIARWVFIADDWFVTSKIFNDGNQAWSDVSWIVDWEEYKWCGDWRLEIRWLLIWSWVNDLIEKRRSDLKTLFSVPIDDRRKVIYSWASLLIQNEPELWTDLPPGLDELWHKIQVKKN